MASFTPTSGANSNADGSIGIGVEVGDGGALGFQSADSTAEYVWNLGIPVPDVELWGTIGTRNRGEADVLVRIFFDNRLVLNWESKKLSAGDCNQWVHVPPMALQKPATTIKVHVDAAGAGDAWPIECEIELAGRWQ